MGKINWYGKVTFVIEGANFVLLLNELNKQNIQVFSANRISATKLEFCVSGKYVAKVVDLLKDKCYTVLQEKGSGLVKLTNSFATRWGILVGGLVGFFLCAFSTMFVWNVNVVDDKSLLYNSMCKVLAENGMGKGSFLPSYDCNKAEILLLENIEKLSLVSVSTRGGSLFINYTIKTSASEIEEDFQVKNIIAKQDAVIASIVVSSGTALVKEGDVVKQGQILIAGYKENEEGEKVECFASGYVNGYVFKSVTTQFPINKIEYVRTEEFVVHNKLYLGDTLIHQIIPQHNFEHFETEQTVSYISNIIPLKQETTKIYKTEGVEVKQSFDEQKQNVIDQTRMLALEQCNNTDNIINESVATNFVADIWFVTYTIKIKEKIS